MLTTAEIQAIIFHLVASSNSDLINAIIENSVTIIIALVAGIIALYQVKSNIVSSARIKWIENLRLTISEYYDAALVSILYLENYRSEIDPEKKTDLYESYVKSHSRYFISSNKIKMYLNTEEDDHNDLERLMDKIDSNFDPINVKNVTQEIVEKDLKKIVKISRKIFKDEWEKSKKIFKI